MKHQIGLIGSSEEREEGKKEAKKIGREIAKAGCTLFTGGCTGLPHSAVKGAKEENGRTIGISPASNEKEHLEKYQYPLEEYDAMVYTGFGYKGRNVILVRSCEGVISTGGKLGTLNELTIAHSEERVIGLLTGVSGAANEFGELAEKLGRPGRKVIPHENPEKLVEKVLRELNVD